MPTAHLPSSTGSFSTRPTAAVLSKHLHQTWIRAESTMSSSTCAIPPSHVGGLRHLVGWPSCHSTLRIVGFHSTVSHTSHLPSTSKTRATLCLNIFGATRTSDHPRHIIFGRSLSPRRRSSIRSLGSRLQSRLQNASPSRSAGNSGSRLVQDVDRIVLISHLRCDVTSREDEEHLCPDVVRTSLKQRL